MPMRLFTNSSFWAQVFLTNLTSLLIVYFAEEAIFRDTVSVPGGVYAIFAFLLITTIFPCLAFLFIFRHKTPSDTLLDNRVLWLCTLIVGSAYISGISTSSVSAATILDIVAVSVFYITGFRLLQMNENGLGTGEKLQSAIKNFLKIFAVSVSIALMILFLF